MTIPVVDDVAFWRDRAMGTRAAAQRMQDQRCREEVLAIAASYERMAGLAQARIARATALARSRLTWQLAGALGGLLGITLVRVFGWA